jgi:hypothetical protein
MSDISGLVKRLREHAENMYVDFLNEAADALEARAKEIAEKDTRIAELEAALSSVLIGGNHLALLIGADHPLHTASHDEARAHYGSGDIYEIWCCWRAMMNAGPVLDASAALKGEK